MLVSLLFYALREALTEPWIGQLGDGVAEISGGATASAAEDLALLAKATAIIDDRDAPRAGGFGHCATERFGECRMMIQQGVPVPDV